MGGEGAGLPPVGLLLFWFPLRRHGALHLLTDKERENYGTTGNTQAGSERHEKASGDRESGKNAGGKAEATGREAKEEGLLTRFRAAWQGWRASQSGTEASGGRSMSVLPEEW